MKAEFINPFVKATYDVFSTMLNCQLSRGELSLNSGFQPDYDVSGVIGLTGKASGSVVVSLEKGVALSATEALIGSTADTLNEDVVDAVGELTNMIAGSAKAALANLEMSISLPNVIAGKNHVISFGSTAQTICVPFTCTWGKLSVEVGLADTAE